MRQFPVTASSIIFLFFPTSDAWRRTRSITPRGPLFAFILLGFQGIRRRRRRFRAVLSFRQRLFLSHAFRVGNADVDAGRSRGSRASSSTQIRLQRSLCLVRQPHCRRVLSSHHSIAVRHAGSNAYQIRTRTALSFLRSRRLVEVDFVFFILFLVRSAHSRRKSLRMQKPAYS